MAMLGYVGRGGSGGGRRMVGAIWPHESISVWRCLPSRLSDPVGVAARAAEELRKSCGGFLIGSVAGLKGAVYAGTLGHSL